LGVSKPPIAVSTTSQEMVENCAAIHFPVDQPRQHFIALGARQENLPEAADDPAIEDRSAHEVARQET